MDRKETFIFWAGQLISNRQRYSADTEHCIACGEILQFVLQKLADIEKSEELNG
jgi:hypothetical protein